jgi:hypothetical protein
VSRLPINSCLGQIALSDIVATPFSHWSHSPKEKVRPVKLGYGQVILTSFIFTSWPVYLRQYEADCASDMTDERDTGSGSSPLLWILALALIPLLYFLSVGPVLLLFKGKANPPTAALRTFYYPLIVLHDHTPLKKPIEAYCDLWGVH